MQDYRAQARANFWSFPTAIPNTPKSVRRSRPGVAWTATAPQADAMYLPTSVALRDQKANARAYTLLHTLVASAGGSTRDVSRAAGGAHGETFRMRVTPQTLGALEALRVQLSHRVEAPAHLPPVGSRVIVKLQFLHPSYGDADADRPAMWKTFLTDAGLEARNHAYLMGRNVTLRCGIGRAVTLTGEQCVPQFFFGGALRSLGIYIIVMSQVLGRPMEKADMKPEQFASVEKGIMTLTLLGLAHGDLHTKNMMVHKKRVTIIDFGLSRRLPALLQARARVAVQRALSGEGTPDAVWHGEDGAGRAGTIVGYMNSWMKREGYPYYHSEARWLRDYYARAMRHPNAAARIAAARRVLWGCPGAFTPFKAITRAPKA